MNTNWHTLKLLLPAILGLAFCCQCKTTEKTDGVITSLDGGSKFGKLGKLSTVGMKRESGYKFQGVNDNELKGSGKKNESADRVANTLKNEKVIKNSKGEVVRKEKRGDLYSDRSSTSARETNRAFSGNKQAKIKTNSFADKKFKTPEYLQRQEFAGNKTFRDGDRKASDSGQESKSFAGKLFKTNRSALGNQSARENGSRVGEADKTFKTSSDRISTRALENSAEPEGVRVTKGYRDNVNLSLDDVKKLVNPSSVR
jgi:hypothetical protein